MVINSLKLIYDQNQDKNSLFLRNLLKEQLQYYVLNYISNSDYAQRLLFKGGTCLRFCFGLPRLSEDLDFDIEEFSQFDFTKFTADIKFYFQSKLKYDSLGVKISGKNNIIYLRFPILRDIGFPVLKESENILFLRIDLAPLEGQFFAKEISLKSTSDFAFLIRRYSLPDLFAGKVAALLERETIEGTKMKPRFKGRDYFDLFWFLEKKVKLNYKYLFSISKISTKQEVWQKIDEKLKQAKGKREEIKQDLLPFFDNPGFVEDFVSNLDKLSFSPKLFI